MINTTAMISTAHLATSLATRVLEPNEDRAHSQAVPQQTCKREGTTDEKENIESPVPAKSRRRSSFVDMLKSRRTSFLQMIESSRSSSRSSSQSSSWSSFREAEEETSGHWSKDNAYIIPLASLPGGSLALMRVS